MISREQVEDILRKLPRLTIGLVGDLFLDRYLELVPGVEELSIETGIEAWQIQSVRNSPGAMGTVLNNLTALGAGLLTPVTVIGDDGHGFDLLREVRKLPVDTSQLMCVRNRLTPTYTKPMRPLPEGGSRELNRLDFRTRMPLEMETTVELCGRVTHAFHSSDGLIVLDQIAADEEGVVNAAVRDTLAELHRQRPDKLIFIDSRWHLGDFAFGVQKGNGEEIVRAAARMKGMSASTAAASSPEQSAVELCERTGKEVYCTLGDRGIAIASPDSDLTVVPGYKVRGPVDIVGAGDAASSGIVAALLAGASPSEAAQFGNLVASITVQKLGTTGTASAAEVLARYDEAVRQL